MDGRENDPFTGGWLIRVLVVTTAAPPFQQLRLRRADRAADRLDRFSNHTRGSPPPAGKLNPHSAHEPGSKSGREDDSKTPFTRPECGQNCWGKPLFAVICKPCGVEMKPVNKKAEVDAAA